MYKKHDKNKIKELYKSGMRQTDICKMLGASKSIVSYHIRNNISDNGICSCMYCHSQDTRLHYENHKRKGKLYYVACRSCHSRGPDRIAKYEAIKVWNLYNRNMYDDQGG